jgi:transglutaminase-like putative cysteine protease
MSPVSIQKRPRTAVGPFVLLVLTDLAAVATLARCFTGPGELVVALPSCLFVHLVLGGGRRFLARGEKRAVKLVLLALVAVAGALLLPMAVLDGGHFSGPIPLGPAFQVVHHQLTRAFSIFSNKIAPVAQAPGLVLVTAWAAGAVAFAAEVLYADSGLPAVLALVPAFDVVVFAGTLGTSSGRAVELALIASLSLGFLSLSQGDRRQQRPVVMAKTEASSAPSRKRSERHLFFPGVAAVAAVAAGVVGPLIPGATSAPLVAWHGAVAGRGRGPGSGTGSGRTGHGSPNSIFVSDLVEVAQQEVSNSDGLLFVVHSRWRTREVLTTLDHFNGIVWSSTTAPQSQLLSPGRLGGIGELSRHPPAVRSTPDGSREVTEVLDIASLGGKNLPVPGSVVALEGERPAYEHSDGRVEAPALLQTGDSYAVEARLPPHNQAALSSEQAFGFAETGQPKADLQLPGPVPGRIAVLAHSIVGTSTNEYERAVLLQDYFLSGHGFRYHLPLVTPRGNIANTSQSYRALLAFLFSTRTGYCQQYATAFAVLARLDGLPTRIALGFLPGKQIGRDTYEVTGHEVHAWPQVWFPHYGWVNFDPTPGALRGTPSSGPSTPSTTLGGPLPVHAQPPAHNLRKLPSTGGANKGAKKLARPARSIGQSGLSYLIFGLLALGLAWAVAIPLLRLFYWRRLRSDPVLAVQGAWELATVALAAASAHRRRSETNLEFARRVRRVGLLSEPATVALLSLARRLDQAVYGPPLSKELRRLEADAAWNEAKQVRASARRRVPRAQLVLGLFDPRDLLAT